jgi:hypothetical protein
MIDYTKAGFGIIEDHIITDQPTSPAFQANPFTVKNRAIIYNFKNPGRTNIYTLFLRTITLAAARVIYMQTSPCRQVTVH